MKTTIGGDRLGSGNKQEVSVKNYSRSTHDLSYTWRSSMASGTLVPFMSELALPGDSWDINLNADVLTLPTIGPLFGSFKVQLDVFEVPIRLYNAGLHMNRLGIGMDMSEVYLPQIQLLTNNHADYVPSFDDNEQVAASSLMKYLGVSGLGAISGGTNPGRRNFNAVAYLGYWDIYKNYYANKQEERGFVIHTSEALPSAIQTALLRNVNDLVGDIYNNSTLNTGVQETNLDLLFTDDSLEPDISSITIDVNGTTYALTDLWTSVVWKDTEKKIRCANYNLTEAGNVTWEVPVQTPQLEGEVGEQIQLYEFDLDNIDKMREDILQYPFASGAYVINVNAEEPYGLPMESIGADADLKYGIQYGQEGLGIKTYQSDLFNNWISTEWIDGASGVNAVTAVSTVGDEFTIDALNIASKVYNMLNRIALSGGSYDDWLDAVYTHERARSVESPVYHGSLIKELGFQEVVSNSDAETTEGGDQPLGTLAGRGRLTQKNKGGKMTIKVNEPSYIIGIVSITPRIDYSQGNKWDTTLETMDDLHKPALDAIGFQDLVTDQILWSDTVTNGATGATTYKSAGKQPAWINYMTNVNKVYGNFAIENNAMYMVNNRTYDKNGATGAIADMTTYIDPSKVNHIFAQTELDSQNFWVQISNNITARRKMSAKVIPNL